ncbi:uroporphyrinogen-III C-methyltransferase [Azohydromonas sediminis]|uniref:uroporphyrinogen-III C-methyltransferase n=1 Tax=Azohydromonas sediminis TaxID=2259674 RepID=UPI000E6544D5|nr:uroporphyrinogen-III C-methyltransferase [Azohydromonas sediminis]
MTGRVVFVGAGPGAADLITLRGARALAEADVVLHDALTDPALRGLAPHATWIDVGKRGFGASTAQAHIDALLVRHALRGERVVRLKGGDPSVFGRLEEELQALARAGIDAEVVPGVTAALAAAAAAQRPLTRRGRGRSVALTTAVRAAADGTARVDARRSADTEVFYMAGRQLGALARALRAAGWEADAPVCVVSRAGSPDALASDHTVATLAAAALLHAGRPAVVTVGVGAQTVVPRGHGGARDGAPKGPKTLGLEKHQGCPRTPAT